MDTNELLMKIARKESETEPILSIRQFAVDMAIRIKSLQPNMPLIIDMNAIPTESGLTVSKWLDIVHNQKVAFVRDTPDVIAPLDLVSDILINAKRITNFIIDGTTGNKRDNQEVL